VLTGDGGVATRRHTEGNERRRLELIVRAKEGAKELGRDGMRCGEIRGVSSPFYIGRGSAGEGWPGGVTAALMALTPLNTEARLRGVLRRGNDGGVSNGSGGIRGWSWAARGGRRR
jgi:hypothetical protein